MKKPMIIMLISIGILFSLIFGWKAIQSMMIKKYLSAQKQVVTVSTMTIKSLPWQNQLQSVASLRARLGVNVTTELAGLVTKIYFTPGQKVAKGALLVQLNDATEKAQLRSLQAQQTLAKITYQRDKAQYNIHAVSKQALDTDEWNVKNLQAQIEQQISIIDKKTIRAPFEGYLGINNVNPGQYINPGDTMTVLQSLDPIYADFYLPQHTLAQLQLGQIVTIDSPTVPGTRYKGKITTIQPLVDTATRNVLVEATLANPQSKLRPGMFVKAEVTIGKTQQYITIPQSAISFNPFGDMVFIVNMDDTKEAKKSQERTVKQVFITVGATRGDQIQVLKGLKEGDVIVTSGQLKLKNGSAIEINNHIQPSNNA